MESQTAQFCGFNAQILEGLGAWVNLLVNEFPLDLICGSGRPPDQLIQPVSCRLQDALGQVDVPTVFDDFSIHKHCDLRSRVVLWSI